MVRVPLPFPSLWWTTIRCIEHGYPIYIMKGPFMPSELEWWRSFGRDPIDALTKQPIEGVFRSQSRAIARIWAEVENAASNLRRRSFNITRFGHPTLPILSHDADTSCLPFGEKATAPTGHEWSLSVCRFAPVVVSQRTISSWDADTNHCLARRSQRYPCPSNL
jgi:hypothetical protein